MGGQSPDGQTRLEATCGEGRGHVCTAEAEGKCMPSWLPLFTRVSCLSQMLFSKKDEVGVVLFGTEGE